jgi:hypothetical protein
LSGLEGAGDILTLEQKLRDLPLVDPSKVSVKFPLPDVIALPHLAVQEGLQCKQCGYIVCSKAWMQQHIQSHRSVKRPRGRPRKTAESINGFEDAGQGLWERVHCQRFFVSGPQSRFFRVAPPLEPTRPTPIDTKL